ncbi:hypothetical protein OPT61_g1296 [Boeremia exigua]|uniref:Uncharacterized protein n=1 Tax=Boeremia exigua TaxID=749465 RepID=A0ACC2IR00_9PLEO|nr:hypothetical protein OPT61_g1296 [Boeremia exigua]
MEGATPKKYLYAVGVLWEWTMICTAHTIQSYYDLWAGLAVYGHSGEPSGADGGGWNNPQSGPAHKNNASWATRGLTIASPKPVVP